MFIFNIFSVMTLFEGSLICVKYEVVIRDYEPENNNQINVHYS